MQSAAKARLVAEIDWASWKPVDLATLVFTVCDDRMLLILKKRGLGAGKINAPGGRTEPGETSDACAIREVQEELVITPKQVEHIGENRFQFVDGYSIHVQVYRAGGYTGEPTETDEAVPHWFALDAIPYERMWEDDRLWVPHVLERRAFSGRFIFDDDRMLDHAIDLE